MHKQMYPIQHYKYLSSSQILHCILHLVVILDIDNSLLPLASGHLAVEQDVNLTVRSALHLRQEEVCHDEAEETSAAPNVAALAAEVGALWRLSALIRVCVFG